MSKLNAPLTLDQLLAPRPPRISWIEPRILPKSAKILLGGEAKIGKSFTSMELGVAAATATAPGGGPTMWTPAPAKVLLCDKELGQETLGERAIRYLGEKTEEQRELARRNLMFKTGDAALKFDALHMRRAIQDQLDEWQPNILIIDPVSKFMQGSDQQNDDVKSFLEFIDILIERYASTTQMSVIMSHHFKKPSHDFRGAKIDPGSSYNFRGGSKWYDDMDTMITIQRHNITDEHWRLECQAETRHGKSPKPFWLDVQPESLTPVHEFVKVEEPAEKPKTMRERLLR